jgi:hypothetical protein
MAKESTLTLTLKVDDQGTVVLDQFTKKIQKAGDDVGKMAKSMQVVSVAAFVNIAQQAMDAGERVFNFARSIASAGNDIQRMSRVFNMTTEEFQKWSYVAKMADVELEGFGQGFKFLTRSMSEALKGSGDAYEAFKILGVSLKDVNLKTKDQQTVMMETIGALGKYADGVNRDKLMLDIFGRSWMSFKPLVNEGTEAIEKYGKRAKELGNIMGIDVIKSLSESETKFKEFEFTMKVFMTQILAPLVVHFTNLLEKLLEVRKWFQTPLSDNSFLKDMLTSILGAEIAAKKGISFLEGYKIAVARVKEKEGPPTELLVSHGAGYTSTYKQEVPEKYGISELELQDRLSKSKLYYQGWLEERTTEGQLAIGLLQSDLDKLAATWAGTEFEYPVQDILPHLMQIANAEGEILTLTKEQYDLRKYMNLEAAELLATVRMLKDATGAEFTYPTEDILSEWTTHPKTGKPVLVEQWKNEVNQMQTIFETFGSNIQSVWSENVTGILKGTTTIADGFKNMARAGGDAFISAITKMIANWILFGNVTGGGFGSGMAKSPSTGTGFIGILGSVGKLLSLQHGGVFTSPTPALVGDVPEAVIPLKGGKIPIEGGKKGDTYITYIEATDMDSFSRKYGPVIEGIYFKGKRFNKVSFRG